jgi:hypothetical protein
MRNDKGGDDVVYPVRFKRQFFERILTTAKREDLNAVQFIRRAVTREIESREDKFSKTLRKIGEPE